MSPKEIENTGMECYAILYIQKHGKEGWAYAFATYCDHCGCIDTCNIVNGKVEITPTGIKMMDKILAVLHAKKEGSK
jgi:hypothetical protein